MPTMLEFLPQPLVKVPGGYTSGRGVFFHIAMIWVPDVEGFMQCAFFGMLSELGAFV
jgi:hypothetical protein